MGKRCLIPLRLDPRHGAEDNFSIDLSAPQIDDVFHHHRVSDPLRLPAVEQNIPFAHRFGLNVPDICSTGEVNGAEVCQQPK